MNYAKIYESIIEKRKINIPTGYTEEHHIVPRSLDGTDDKTNLVKLTAKEHFICHLLLTKMYPKGSLEYYKMSHAFLMMFVSSKDHGGNRYITSKKYEKLKVSFSERMTMLQIGENNSQYGTMWIHNKTLKQCKKVPKDSILDDGWEIGRKIKWDKPIKLFQLICSNCNVAFYYKIKDKKCCSIKCARDIASKISSYKNKKKVLIDGIVYDSVHDAGIAMGVSPITITYRIKNNGYGIFLDN